MFRPVISGLRSRVLSPNSAARQGSIRPLTFVTRAQRSNRSKSQLTSFECSSSVIAERQSLPFVHQRQYVGAGFTTSAKQLNTTIAAPRNRWDDKLEPISDETPAPANTSHRPDEKDVDMTAGIRSDLKMVRETFALRDVPREVTLLGLAGLLPYVGTSSLTLFMAYESRHIGQHGVGQLFTEDQAVSLLNFLEPVQVGYGAVILSFLGAIHWGLEFAKFGGSAPYQRYFLGILAPAIAWPTVFMPYDYALIAQFAGFVTMYFADAQATVRGWAPKWYTTYRFILTFVVGASLLVTLVGRGKIGDNLTEVSDPSSRVMSLTAKQRVGLEAESGGTKFQQKMKEEEDEIKATKLAEEEEAEKQQQNEEDQSDEDNDNARADSKPTPESKDNTSTQKAIPQDKNKDQGKAKADKKITPEPDDDGKKKDKEAQDTDKKSN